jgi:hypothetical protein
MHASISVSGILYALPNLVALSFPARISLNTW